MVSDYLCDPVSATVTGQEIIKTERTSYCVDVCLFRPYSSKTLGIVIPSSYGIIEFFTLALTMMSWTSGFRGYSLSSGHRLRFDRCVSSSLPYVQDMARNWCYCCYNCQMLIATESTDVIAVASTAILMTVIKVIAHDC